MIERLRRLASARVVRAKGSLTLVHGDGSASRLEDDSALLCDAVLAFFDEPRSRDEVVAHVAALADGPVDERVVDDLLALLSRAAVLGPAATAPEVTKGGSRHGASARKQRLVLAVTGAIQAVEAPRLVGLLQSRGFEVRVAATRAARRFVSVEALAALTHCAVATSLWGSPQHPAAHIELSEWADVVVVYPASATTLSRLARGDFSDIVAAVALATPAPVLVVPSMNENMLRAPAVVRNLECLRDDGFFVAEPASGIEVADPPERRALRAGAALSPERVLDLVALVAAQGGRGRGPVAAESVAPELVVDWERVYENELETLPWTSEQVPADLAAELAALPPPRSLLDLGTGLGALAIHAAERGYRVVATDLSRAAIARAQRRAGDLPITFVRDDVTDTRISGTFDVVVDRGLLHVLADSEIRAHGETIAKLVRPGGALLLVSDGHAAGADRRTRRFSPEELSSQLPGFSLERASATTLVESDPGTAWLTVWHRRG